ncbi:hypothetical protein K493DRAFT_306303 [Basidiobolus meristosporus CBS 931.73]|uniref:Uncharacterized protein n=1 Tax=Basidiobolus meristosporus CBS 931.73 TaxID=1314790 RepID=A0A1Y1XSV2_9FUNG|nr:hypothetical protein K493DRAFT_306303 [Basidiobolus meristosporus CBS 931.73]|eukprot:ORX88821.1 hypothetical protein K493DRAFT_306303 [Basidiobolus meristosporus CBS 931.73]
MWLFFSLILLAFSVGINADAIDMWVNPSQNKKITGFYSSLEIPTGFDPPTTYWCVAGWHLGYYGVQKGSDGSHILIMSEWNDGSKSPAIERSIPHGEISQCEENCPEGAMAHVLIPGHAWRTGVKYDFKLEVDFNGTNEIFHSYLFTNNHWKLIAQIVAPNYGQVGLESVFQFLENWETNDNLERRGIYTNQHFRYEGDERWYPAASISPFNNANVVHPHYYADAVPLDEGNGIMLKLDGTGPPDKNGWMYYPQMHINASNMVPPQENPPPMHGKHTVTVVETYVGYKRFTDSPVTTTTTKKQWHTNTFEPTVTRLETLLDTTVQTQIVRGTKTETVTFAPSAGMETEFQTMNEVETVTDLLHQRTTTVTHSTVEAQGFTVFETVQPTITAPAVTATILV